SVDWSMFGFSASGGRYNSAETLITPQNVGSLTLAFQFMTPNIVDIPPVVVNGIAYFGSGHTFYAVDGTTGTQVWSRTFAAHLNDSSSAAAANGVVYISAGRFLVAMDASTGTILWNFGLNAKGLIRPTILDGVIYFGAADRNVYALNATTGELIWKFATGN